MMIMIQQVIVKILSLENFIVTIVIDLSTILKPLSFFNPYR